MIIWELTAIAVLIMLNGYFSMAAMAIVSARRTQLRELANHGSKGARGPLTNTVFGLVPLFGHDT